MYSRLVLKRCCFRKIARYGSRRDRPFLDDAVVSRLNPVRNCFRQFIRPCRDSLDSYADGLSSTFIGATEQLDCMYFIHAGN